MARVLLIHPSLGFSAGDELVKSQPQRYLPLGLTYLASSLIAAGHGVSIQDLNVSLLGREAFQNVVREYSPDISGIYTNSFNLRQTKELVRAIREVSGNPIVLGGPHVTYRPETLLWAGADFVIRGDGEKALVCLVDALEGKETLADVEGLARVEKGEFVAAPPACLTDLDSLPHPARHLLVRDHYHIPVAIGPMTPLVTARGCPFRCLFCAMPNHAHYRTRDPRLAAMEMLELDSQNYRYVDIHDPTFSWKADRVEAFCQTLIENGSRLKWGCETRADSVSREILRLMKRAGCVNVRFGVESGVEHVRNTVIGKKLTNAQIREAVKEARSTGLETMTFFIFGHPGERLEEMKESLRFGLELGATYADFSLCAPIVGSRLYAKMVEEGKIPPDVWEQVAEGRTVPFYIPDGVKASDINKLRASAYRKHYLSPRSLLYQLRRVKSPKDLVVRLRAGLTVLRTSHRKEPVIW